MFTVFNLGEYMVKHHDYHMPNLIRRVCNGTDDSVGYGNALLTVVSPGTMRINFVSDYSVTRQGFIIEYKAGKKKKNF